MDCMEPAVKRPKMHTIDSEDDNEGTASTSTVVNKDSSINVGESIFENMSKESWYVDKTLFIKAILGTTTRVLIAAPRRFGKTTNLSMLQRFVEIELNPDGSRVSLAMTKDGDEEYLSDKQTSRNFNLFTSKNIFTIEQNGKQIFDKELFTQHFGRYPVIYVDFKGVCGDTPEKILASLKDATFDSFQQHSYLENSDKVSEFDKKTLNKYFDEDRHKDLSEGDILNGLKKLSRILCKYFEGGKRVIVLIDEYDAPVSEILFENGMSKLNINKSINLIGKFISALLKSNVHVERGIIFASHHIGGVLSARANNIEHYAFLHEEFCRFFGFTGEELKKLLLSRNVSNVEMKAVKDWYNGYTAIDSNNCLVEIYSTWSIMKYLRSGNLESYWCSGMLRKLKKILLHKQMKEAIMDLMNGNTVQIKYIGKLDVEDVQSLQSMINTNSTNIDSDDVNLFLEFLFGHGYLNLESIEGDKYKLKLPNREIYKNFYTTIISAQYFVKHNNISQTAINEYSVALRHVVKEHNEKSFLELAKAVRELYCSNIDSELPKREFEFHAKLFELTKLQYKNTKGELQTSATRGFRADIVLCSEEDESGIIFELKLHNESSQSAIEQILTNKYYNKLKDKTWVKKIILIGLHLNTDRQVHISYLINNYQKENIKTVWTDQ